MEKVTTRINGKKLNVENITIVNNDIKEKCHFCGNIEVTRGRDSIEITTIHPPKNENKYKKLNFLKKLFESQKDIELTTKVDGVKNHYTIEVEAFEISVSALVAASTIRGVIK